MLLLIPFLKGGGFYWRRSFRLRMRGIASLSADGSEVTGIYRLITTGRDLKIPTSQIGPYLISISSHPSPGTTRKTLPRNSFSLNSGGDFWLKGRRVERIVSG